MQNYMLIEFSFEMYREITLALGKEPTVFLSDCKKDRAKIKEKYNKESLTPYINLRASQELEPFNIKSASSEFYEIFEKVRPQQEIFKNCAMRYKDKPRRAATPPGLADIENKFYLMCLNAYNNITHNKLKCLMFVDIPHEACIYAHYVVAKAMNITTIICRQSISSDYFYITENTESTLREDITGNNKNFKIDLTSKPKEPEYMHNKKKFCKFPFKELLKVIARSLLIFPIFKGNSRKKLRIAYSRYSYQKYYQKNIGKNLDLSKLKYVYFPMHFQPEMTTNVLGNEYVNQARALCELRKILPNEYTIVIKENPIQDWYMREKSFFKVVDTLPNIAYASLQTSTYELVKNAVAVTAIAGTAGFEALSYKKPVICFGVPWYKSFPGVFDFSRIKDITKVLNFSFDITESQAAADQFAAKLYKGFAPQRQAKGWNKHDLDVNANASDIAKAVKEYLNHLKL